MIGSALVQNHGAPINHATKAGFNRRPEGLIDSAPVGGGTWGAAFSGVLRSGMGGVGAFLLALGAFLFSLQLVFEIRWASAARAFWKLLLEDYAAWSKARADMNELRARAPSPDDAAKSKSKDPAQPTKAVDVREVKPLLNGVNDHRTLPTLIETTQAARPARGDGARPGAPSAASPHKDYALPPLELLSLPSDARHRGKPTQAEIKSAVADLERTLKSFAIDAHVSGYSPGPVITRYEISPAPGVKVS